MKTALEMSVSAMPIATVMKRSIFQTWSRRKQNFYEMTVLLITAMPTQTEMEKLTWLTWW